MAKGIDCAQPLTANTVKALAAAGHTFVARYLVPESFAWKRLTISEAKAITETGMKIISVFETTANRPAGGVSFGSQDGRAAYKEAIAIEQTVGTAIYFAVDYDAKPEDYDEIEAYLRAAAKEIKGYHVGVYGSYSVIEEMLRRGAARHFWQTLAWSKNKKSDRANIWQYRIEEKVAGHPVDLNESYGNEGWWNTKPEVELPKLPDLSKAQAIFAMVNGKRIADGILVNGFSYVLARSVATELGLNIYFDAKNKSVSLND